MSQSLIAFDTDHIKGYVFRTGKLKEIRGASSLLDRLNRVKRFTIAKAKKLDPKAITVFANGGSALFVIATDKAEQLGADVQKLYRMETGGGGSITYVIQPIPPNNATDIMTEKELDEHITMRDLLKLMRLRLRLAKDSQSDGKLQDEPRLDVVALPTHALLFTCKSCGLAYAQEMDEPETLYCRVCIGKRDEDEAVRIGKRNGKEIIRKGIPDIIRDIQSGSPPPEDNEQELWERILRILSKKGYQHLTPETSRPPDFNEFSRLQSGKDYLGLIYADGNSMGTAMEKLETLQAVQDFAKIVDNAVFEAMGDAIKAHLPVQRDTLPFDILMVGGDDIVMVTPAKKALQVAYMLAQRFRMYTDKMCAEKKIPIDKPLTLSVGVVLAPIKYPFNLQRKLADDTLKSAKKAGAEDENKSNGAQGVEATLKDAKQVGAKDKNKSIDAQEEARINFVVITGSTSLSYAKIYEEMFRLDQTKKENFYATMRPYTLTDFDWLLKQLKRGGDKRLGRTKLHQLHEAILKLNGTTTILETLTLFRNWKEDERDFIRDLVRKFDTHLSYQERQRHGTVFPWYLEARNHPDAYNIYRTPLLDFIELYDFVSS